MGMEAFTRPDGWDPGELPPMEPDDVIAEVSGRDSVAAAVALLRDSGGAGRRVLPSVAYTGTEYGDMGSLEANVERLRALLEPVGVEVLMPVMTGSPRWWNAVAGRFNSLLASRYGPWHVCIGCHMYLHALRVPLAWRTGARRVVAGERLGHGGRVKVNQTAFAVEAYRSLLGEFGVRLELPLLVVDDEDELLSLVGEWREGEGQPSCALSGNYLGVAGEVLFDEERAHAYLEEYLLPLTRRILLSLRDGGEADYRGLAREVLEGYGKRA